MSTARRFANEHFLNRELSLLAFNRRVLAQAADDRVPLLERLRFLCIVSSNLDEFFEIRVAGLKEQIKLASHTASADGLPAHDVFRRVTEQAHALIAEQYVLLNDEILPALAAEGIAFVRRSLWNDEQRIWIREYFRREVMPVLTPIGLDPSHPFPRVLNKSLNFAIELEGTDAFGRNSGAAIVQAPRALPRVIQLPKDLCGFDYGFVFLSSVMHEYVDELFAGMNVLGCYQFRVTRNSDLFVDDEEVKNLRIALQGELPQRHFGDAVRLEVADNCSEVMTEFLLQQFDLERSDLYRVPGIVNLVRLMSVPDQVDRPDLMYPPFQPGLPKVLAKRYDIFASIRKHDILMHHPFQSFSPVIQLLQQAADDPQVVAIKMTVYRTGTDSVLMEHLLRAAEKGKEVTVVVELMARFDEEANLSIAARLEQVGAHVVYGVVGYKTHAKMLMVLRREDHGYRRYIHLGTGNYHPRTTRFYTDFGLLTANTEIGDDVNEVFKQLTGLGKATALKHLWQAPFSLHPRMLEAIRGEIDAARAGHPARIIAKMNSLLEPEIIEALYDASAAGVTIDLIVRGVCSLRPGVKGLSENIRVRSVIGRFLEHHRIFYFHGGGRQDIYLSSADWMERNFFRRIEISFPVLDPKLKRRVLKEGLKSYLADNCQAWEMNGTGEYRIKPARRKRVSAQELLLADMGVGVVSAT
ncbi:MAG: polyphosphate kinase 1 [Sterolibacteriaceae bacterium]|uniref:polyphosphate kinase 1 n=1 Tax=Sulfuritalea sp. TaxID=2480090 RepID=UPI001A3CBEAF|nr:polyphosphate kinase 1 [Sulfuritalea sp.]MBL8478634.1 polyphosphate kinase 1 [Sterolibacteriaceae bacterium]MBN8473827.1 polyphosphate kinase 1 [Sulfuritalea sp.]